MVWGIVGALNEEIALIKEKMLINKTIDKYGTTFYKGLLGNKLVVVVCCGIGKVNAAVCTNAVINEFGADFVLNVGIAGAMQSGLSVMDVVISSEVGFHDQDEIMKNYYPEKPFFEASPVLSSLCENACEKMGDDLKGKYIRGRIMSGDVFVNDTKIKDQINNKYKPACVEMEGAAIGHVAFMNNKPFLVIRTMSDSADDSADENYDNFINVAAHQSSSIILNMLQI